MNKGLFFVVLAAAACGSKNKNTTDEPTGATIDPNMSSGDSTDRSGDQLDPTKMDEVNNLLDRRRNIVSRCLSTAVEAGNAPKNARGKITLEITPGVSRMTVARSRMRRSDPMRLESWMPACMRARAMGASV